MRILLVSLLTTLCFSYATADSLLKDRAAKSKQVVQQFMEQLKGELTEAMQSGGPVSAISVCNHKAPVIARELSAQYGWTIARTSLNVRNMENAPDDWEREILQNFEHRKAQGEDVKPMAYFAKVSQDGKDQFRFMKAIPTAEVCLKCHGQNLAPDVQAKLDELYPSDKARGYKTGDIRGAFTISQPL